MIPNSNMICQGDLLELYVICSGKRINPHLLEPIVLLAHQRTVAPRVIGHAQVGKLPVALLSAINHGRGVGAGVLSRLFQSNCRSRVG